MARFARPETLFFLACWAGLLVAFRERALLDPGALWHPVVGEIILTDGFPRTDPFTFPFEGKAWIPQQWGGEVLMALAHRAGGLDGLLVGFAAVLAALWAWAFARLRAGGMGTPLAAAVTVLALAAGAFHYFARPHLATIALMGWVASVLVDYDRGRVSMWRLVGLVPLCVVWTNLHGGVLGGVVTLGLAVAGWIAFGVASPQVRKSASPDLRRSALLILIVLACLLTPLANPFGLEMIRTWQRIVGSSAMKEIVDEHKPLDPTDVPGLGVLGFGLLYLFVLAGTWGQRPRVTWALPLVWLALSLKGIRQGPLFVVVAAVVMADVWPHTRWHRYLLTHGDTLAVPPAAGPATNWRAWVLPAVAVLAAFGLQLGGVEAPLVGRGWARLDPDLIPVDMTDDLREYARQRGPGARVFNDANLGGYLIYHVPGLKIYADDRFELSGDDWLREYWDFLNHHPERIDEWADRWGFDRALLKKYPKEQLVETYIKATLRWRVVRAGPAATLYERVR